MQMRLHHAGGRHARRTIAPACGTAHGLRGECAPAIVGIPFPHRESPQASVLRECAAFFAAVPLQQEMTMHKCVHMLACLAVIGLPVNAHARPVSYPGGWTVMQMNDMAS